MNTRAIMVQAHRRNSPNTNRNGVSAPVRVQSRTSRPLEKVIDRVFEEHGEAFTILADR